MKKRASFLIVSLVTFSLMGVFTKASFANDAPINLQGGGALPLTGPLSVSMESEIVRIILGKKSYTVDALFNFINSGEAVSLSVGFPKNGVGRLDGRFKQTSEFLKFETWVNDKPVKFVEKPNTASIEGEYTLPALIKYVRKSNNSEKLGVMAKDYRWMVKESVQFPSKKTTTTRVRYEAPYQDFGGECKGGLTYIYGTGSHWDGNIGESKFIVDASGISKKEWPKEMVFVAETDKDKIRCDSIGAGMLQCIIKDYKPATPEAGVVVGVGCIDLE